MKKIFFVLLLTAIAGVAWYFYGHLMPTASIAKPSAGLGRGGPIAVEVITIASQSTSIVRQMPGRVSAFKVAEIRPQVGGIITERLFAEGSQVQRGDVLYSIESAPYQAAVAKAEADLQKARATEQSVLIREKRLQKLVNSKAVSEQEFDDVKADLASARADIDIARAALQQANINLQYTAVKAPISGRIGKSEVSRGALVTMNQSQELARITQLDPVYIDMTISSAELLKIRPRLQNMRDIKVELILDNEVAYPNTGELQFADVTVDESTGSVNLRAQFDNPRQTLLPGMFVRASLSFKLDEALLIPQKTAQREAGGKLFVWLVRDNKAQKQPIKVERSLGNQWLVTDGLQVGNQIVSAGMLKLTASAEVSITAPASDASEP